MSEQSPDDLADLLVFSEVVKAESFTGAAQRLGLSKSAVSTRVRRLEGRLGVELLSRTTRRMALTEAGARLARRAEAIGEAVQEATREAGALGTEMVGRIRMSAPVSLGERHLADAIAAFLEENPRVRLDVDLTDRRVDLLEEDYDLALRVGPLTPSSLRVRRLGSARVVVAGSPAYLDRFGVPADPDELRHHRCLLYRYHLTGPVWTFGEGDEQVRVPVDGPLRSDNGDVLLQAAERGLGLAMLPGFIVSESLRAGRLRSVLDAHCRAETPIHALFPDRRLLAPPLRRFIDTLAAHFAELAPSGLER